MQRLISGGIFSVLIITGLSSCLKSTNTPPEPTTYLALVHAAVTAPSVDIYFGATKASDNALTYGQASNGYSPVKPGTFDVTFKKGGADSLVAAVPIAVYDTSKPYTLLLYSDGDGNGQAEKINDDMSDALVDKMNFRFWHLGYEVGPVDFYIGDTKVASSRTLADNVDINSYNRFTPVEGGSFKLTVKEAGTAVEIATVNEVNLPRGTVWTIFLKGSKTGTGTKALGIGVARNN